MEKKLQLLYNTLYTIETKGEGTKVMAECLKYLENLINEVKTETNTVQQIDPVSAEVTR